MAISAMIRRAAERALLAAAILFALVSIPGATAQEFNPRQPQVKDMKQLGYSDLQGRSAYQPTIEKQGDRFDRLHRPSRW